MSRELEVFHRIKTASSNSFATSQFLHVLFFFTVSVLRFSIFSTRSLICFFVLADQLWVLKCIIYSILLFHSSADPVEHTGAASDRLSREGIRGLSFQLLLRRLETKLPPLCFSCIAGSSIARVSVEVDRIIPVHRKVARGSTHDWGISYPPRCLIDGALPSAAGLQGITHTFL